MKLTLVVLRQAIKQLAEPFTSQQVKDHLKANGIAQLGSAKSLVFHLVKLGELEREVHRGARFAGGCSALFRRTAAFDGAAHEPAPVPAGVKDRLEGIALVQSLALNWGAMRNDAKAAEHVDG